MSIFNKKREISRPKFREILRKSSPFIPGSGGKMYSMSERIKMEKELFPRSRFKGHISEMEIKRRLRELRMEKYRTKTKKEKLNINGKIKFLEGATGVKTY